MTKKARSGHREEKTVGFHGLMDIIGCYSEDNFSRKEPYHHGIQPRGKGYIDVRRNDDGTFTLRGDPDDLE